MIAVTRRFRFPAAHVLRSDALSEAENQRVFGKCANQHGHNYGLEVTVAGQVEPRSGCVIAQDALERIVRERVLRRFSHRLLNEDSAFADQIPTAENIARVVHALLAEPLAQESGGRLQRVRVVETRRNRFEYGECQ